MKFHESRQQLSAKCLQKSFDDRGRDVGQLEADQSATTVSKSVKSRLKKAAECGDAMEKHAGSHEKNTTPQKD